LSLLPLAHRLSNAVTNELIFYQDTAAADLNHLLDMFERLGDAMGDLRHSRGAAADKAFVMPSIVRRDSAFLLFRSCSL
jgi:hypothetical protein